MTLRNLSQAQVEPRQNVIIAMKDMHQLAPATLDATVEHGSHSFMHGLAIERHSAVPAFAHERFNVIFVRAIVHDLNLHLLGAGVLCEDTVERLSEIGRN